MARLISTSSTFSTQKETATPRGTTANVIIVNNGPYGLGS